MIIRRMYYNLMLLKDVSEDNLKSMLSEIVSFVNETTRPLKTAEIVKSLIPEQSRRMGANPHANGGLILKELRLPNFKEYKVDVKTRGETIEQDIKMREISEYLDQMRLYLIDYNMYLRVLHVNLLQQNMKTMNF